jgi:hypothetical protein
MDLSEEALGSLEDAWQGCSEFQLRVHGGEVEDVFGRLVEDKACPISVINQGHDLSPGYLCKEALYPCSAPRGTYQEGGQCGAGVILTQGPFKGGYMGDVCIVLHFEGRVRA